MGLGQALSAAVSGLRVTQSSLSLVAANIANAETPGYVKKTATQVAAASGELTIGVRLSSINRELDQYLQRQLRVESSGGFPELCVLHYNPTRTLFTKAWPTYYAAITDARIVYPWEIDRTGGVEGVMAAPPESN